MVDTTYAIKRALVKTTGIVVFVTLISRVLSYFTIVIIGARFGVSRITDAYLISLIVPEFFILLFGTSVGLSLTTLLSEYITKGNEKQGWELANIILILSLALFSLAAIIIFLLSPILSSLLAPGFDIESKALVTKLSRIALGYMVFAGLTSVTRGVLHSYRRFIIPAINPGLLQIVTVIFVLLWSKNFHILSVNMGLFFGALFCFVLQLFSLRNKVLEFKFRLKWNLYLPELKKTISSIYPLVLYSIIFQVNTSVDRIVASTLKTGSVAALDFAYRINWMFLPVLAGALFTVALPVFSEQVVLKDWEGLKEILSLGVRLLNFLIMPISIFMIFMAQPIIRLIFERGAFDTHATHFTSQALIMYSLGMVPFTMFQITSCALIALGESRSIAKLSFIIVLLNLVLDLILSRYLGHMGIALGTSLVSIFGFWFYMRALQRKVSIISIRDVLGSIIKIFFVSLIIALMGLLIYNLLGTFINTTIFRGQLIQMIIVIFVASILYFGFSFLIRVKEIKELYLLLKRK